MTKHVYLVRSAWYDEYHVFGIYTTLAAARKALSTYVKECAEVGLNTYKWLDKNTVGEFFLSIITDKEEQGNEYKIFKVPLDQWQD